MAKINLLPWREKERQRRQREFGIVVGMAIGATLAVGFAVQTQYAHAIDAQNQRNDLLVREIALLDQRIEKIKRLEALREDLKARIDIIQKLQESRPEIVRLFDEMVKMMPEGVFIVSFKQTGRAVEIEGRAQSNARVSALMRNIERSEWVAAPQLLLIENKDKTGTGLSHFRLRFTQKSQTAEDSAPPAASSRPRGAPPARPPAKGKT